MDALKSDARSGRTATSTPEPLTLGDALAGLGDVYPTVFSPFDRIVRPHAFPPPKGDRERALRIVMGPDWDGS